MPRKLVLDGGEIDEAGAAALAAVAYLLAEADAVEGPTLPVGSAGWRASAKLITQGLAPARVPLAPTWGRIERLRRAGRSGGIGGQ
jgi:hypothetical protein